MKKSSMFQIILLCVFGALGVAGVLIFAFAVGGGSSSSVVGKVVIWGTLDKDAFSAVLEKASQSNQDLQQVSYVQKNEATFEQDLSNALAEKTGPDLLVLRSDYAVKDEPKIASIPYNQLSQVQFQNLFVEAANPYLGQGGVVGIPFAVDPLVLYWNRDLLSSAGISLPPAYWDEVPIIAQKLTTKDSAGQIQKATIALGTYQNIENAKAILSALMMQAGVTITGKSPTGALVPALAQDNASSNSPGVDALRFYTEFADPSQSDYSWNGAMQSARAAFAAGDVALYVGYASEAPLISAMNPNLNFAIAALPQLRGAPRTSDFGHVYAFAVPRQSGNLLGAQTIASLLDTSTTTAALAQALGISSALRTTLAQQRQGDQGVFDAMSIITRTWSDPDPAQTDALFRAMIEGTVSGATPILQAVQNGQQQMAQIIGQ